MGRTTRDPAQPGTTALRRVGFRVIRARARHDGRGISTATSLTTTTTTAAGQRRNGWVGGAAWAWVAWVDDGGAADAVAEAAALGVAGSRRIGRRRRRGRERRCWIGLGRQRVQCVRVAGCRRFRAFTACECNRAASFLQTRNKTLSSPHRFHCFHSAINLWAIMSMSIFLLTLCCRIDHVLMNFFF